jgi:hypothetical protein
VEERRLKLNTALLTRAAQGVSRLPAMKDFMRGVQVALSNSWRSPRRHGYGDVGFLDSDYVKDRILKVLPASYLDRPIAHVTGVPRPIADSFGPTATVRDVLRRDLASLRKFVGKSDPEAAALRGVLLGLRGIGPRSGGPGKASPTDSSR